MHRQIATEKAPKAVGPYSQAVVAFPFLFVSGQLPLNPLTSSIDEVSIEGQTEQVLNNIEAILKEAGLTFEQVVKTEIFLMAISDFKSVNSLYEKRFNGPIKPARQTIQVAGLPLGAKIEISCIAYFGEQ